MIRVQTSTYLLICMYWNIDSSPYMYHVWVLLFSNLIINWTILTGLELVVTLTNVWVNYMRNLTKFGVNHVFEFKLKNWFVS
jgi:hypothetical protein